MSVVNRISRGVLFAPHAGMGGVLAWVHGALLVLQIALILLLVGLLAWGALRRGRREVRTGLLFVVLSILAISLSVAVLVLAVPSGPPQLRAVYGVWGFWNAAGALILAYGVLRTQVFDIDLRVKAGLRRGTVGAVFVAVFFVASEGTAAFLSEWLGAAVGLGAAALLVFALAPLQRMAERISDRAMPTVVDTEEYRVVKKRELYRAAMESAASDGVITERERDLLATLAQELGLGPAEARAIEREAMRAITGGT